MTTHLRRHKRYTLRYPVAVSCGSWSQLAQLYIENISFGGLFIRSEEPLPVGTPIEVKIGIPQGEPLALAGFVVWIMTAEAASETAPAGMGIRFEAITPEQRAELEKLIQMGDDDARPVETTSLPTVKVDDLDSLIDALEAEVAAVEGDQYCATLVADGSQDDDSVRKALEMRLRLYAPEHFERYGNPVVDALAGQLADGLRRNLAALHTTDADAEFSVPNVLESTSTSLKRQHTGEEKKVSAPKAIPPSLATTGPSVTAGIRVALSEARTYAMLGRLDDAKRLVQVVLTRDGENAQALALFYLITARQAREAGDIKQAVDCFRAVLSIQHDNKEAVRALRELTQKPNG